MAQSPKRAGAEITEPLAVSTVTESVYSAAELANAHKMLNASYEIVEIALKFAGVKEATLAEAQRIVDEFKNKEVR